jgi:hypothetical protein
VTTEEPPLEGLRKTSASDVSYGIRVVIGGSSYDWWVAPLGPGCARAKRAAPVLSALHQGRGR